MPTVSQHRRFRCALYTALWFAAGAAAVAAVGAAAGLLPSAWPGYLAVGTLLALLASWAAGPAAPAKRAGGVPVSMQAIQDSLLEGSPEAIVGLDTDLRVTFVNGAGCRVLGYVPEQLVGRHYHELIHSPQRDERAHEQADCPVERCVASGLPGRGEERFKRSDGGWAPVELACTPLWQDGRVAGATVFFADITDRIRSDDSLRQAAAVFESTVEGVMVTKPDGVIVNVNPAFTRITGYTPEEALGETPRILHSDQHDAAFYHGMWQTLLEHGQWRGEVHNRHKDGRVYAEWLTISAVRDNRGRVLNYVGVFQDITELKNTQSALERQALHDALTGLPNRLLFADRLAGALRRAQREGGRLAVLFLDLDRFKLVNDSLGHPAGDVLLREAAARLVTCMRATDTLARLGGDEFVVLLEQVGGEGDAALVARKLAAALGPPFLLEGRETPVSASIGVSLFPRDGSDADVLTRNADAAMYRAKGAGGGCFAFYSPELTEASHRRVRLESDLRHALERNQLFLEYQARIAFGTGRLAGLEVLLRWQHPELGRLGPDDFLTVAEESRLIEPIGVWMLESACRDVAAMHRAGVAPLRVSINLSPALLRQRDFVEQLQRILQHSGLDRGGLELTLTERALMRDRDRATRALHRLRALGVCLAIDGFGSGESSLILLKQLPIDRICIAPELLRGIPRDRDNAAICAAMIDLAHRLDLGVLARGVERPAQRDYLLAHRCDEGQGPLLGKPQPLTDLLPAVGLLRSA